MPGFDVFKADGFSLTSLTADINKMPYKPGRLGELAVFPESGISTLTAMVEEKQGVLSLIQTSPRGGPAAQLGAEKRTVRPFAAVHLEKESTISADEVQGVRAFGSESEAEAVQLKVAERQALLRQEHEVTLEFHRIKALQGIILDADGSTLLNLFTAFEVAQNTGAFDLGTSPDPGVREACVQTRRKIEAEMGAQPVGEIRVLCGADFFDALADAPGVLETVKYQRSELLRGDLRAGFEYGGLTFEEYRGSVSGQAFVAAAEAYAYPENAGIGRTWFAPADFMETVNTIGLPIYSKIVQDTELNRWAKVHTQSNPLVLCLRPRAVVKLTIA